MPEDKTQRTDYLHIQLKRALPHLILCLFVLWAAWQTLQLKSLRHDTNIIAADTRATQSETAALRNEIQRRQPQDKPQSITPLHVVYEPEPEFKPLDIPLSEELQRHAISEAKRIGIEPYILFNLMWRESRFQTDAYRIDTNGLESVGLCQINGITFSFLSERGIDPHTPEGNITAACELISYYRDELGCTLLETLAAYGAGYGGMKRGRGFEAARKLLEGRNWEELGV